MKCLYRSEWMKLMAQTKAKVFLVLVWIGALMISLGNQYFTGSAGFTLIDSSQMPLTMISLLGGLLLPLVVYILAVDTTSLEYRNGTIKYGLMSPAPRHHLYFAKFLAINVYNSLLLAGVLIITIATNLNNPGESLALLLTYIVAYLITLIPLGLVALWGMFIGTFFTSALSIALGIIAVVGLNVGQLFIPILGAVSPLAYMNLYSQLIYGHVAWQTLASALLYLASYYIILIALNLQRFQSKEI